MSDANRTSNPWQKFRRDGLSWSLSLIIHCSILTILALVSVSQPYLAPEDISLSIRKTDEPKSSSQAKQGDSQSIDPQEQLQKLLNQTPMVQPKLLTQIQPPKMLLPEHLKAPNVQADILMQQLHASDLSSGRDRQQIIPMGLLQGTTQGFQKMIGQWRGSGLDVVLVIDVTQSMRPYLDQAKLRLKQIMGVITGILDDETAPMKIVRFGVVAYKDKGDFRNGSGLAQGSCRLQPLTNSLVLVQRFLDSLHASGGGDYEEPITYALRLATDHRYVNWDINRKSLIILVADAPSYKNSEKELKRLATRFGNEHEGRINTIDTGDGKRKQVLQDLQTIAHYGHGESFLLEDQQAFWEHLIASVFGREYKADVDLILQRYLKEKP
ncbi:MAG: VWA domain-containing protein [Phycisphaeraceae bacterium]|nr:VWA domain-containing protein [Phycisphaeraceae bacterium]